MHKKKKMLFGIIFACWGLFIFNLWLFQSGYREFLTSLAVILSGISTLIFWLLRKKFKNIIEKWKVSPRTKFILVGSLAAVYVETIFWIIERIGNFEGIAANPNLLIDLLVTMPWYIVMTALLWKVETKQKYSYLEILILGGIYDFMADGVLGTVLSGVFSLVILIQLIILYPIFFITYSFIVLTPSYLIESEIDSILANQNQEKQNPKFLSGLIPLIGLIVPFVELILVAIVIADPVFGIIFLALIVMIALCIIRKKRRKKEKGKM